MIAIKVTESGLGEVIRTLEGVERLSGPERKELGDGIGRLIQQQTRRRITEEKTTPAGEAWKENLTGTSILYASGALNRSIDYVVNNDEVEVGSGLVYAAIHNFGGEAGRNREVTIPQREYVGLSADNETEIIGEAESFLAELLQ